MTDQAHSDNPELDLFLRLDAMVGQLIGGLQNMITGEGGAGDRVNGWTPQQPTIADDTQLMWMFAGVPWARLICDKPARWLQQAGIRVEQADGLPAGPEGPRGPDDVLALDETLGLTSALGRAFAWARALGGAGVLIDVDGDDDWSRPWEPKPGDVLRLHVYDGIALRPELHGQGDIREPGLPAVWRPYLRHDRPRYYRLLATAYTRGSSQSIHWTRVLPMFGHEIPPGGAALLNHSYRSWPSISIVEHCWAQIRAFGAMDLGIERIMGVLALWIVTLQNLPAMASGPTSANTGTNSSGQSGADAVLAAVANKLRTAGVFFGAPGWDVKPASLSLAGIADLDARNRASLAAASELPQFVLFGEDKGGLGDPGKGPPSWLRTFTTTLRGWWDDQWAWNVRRALTGASIAQLGGAPTSLRVTVGAFVPTSEAEEAEIRKVAAEELAALVKAGILKPLEAHRRYEGGFTLDFPVEAPTDPTVPPDERSDAAPQREPTLIALAQEALPDLLARVRRIVPDLEAEEWPHLTLLYLGDVPERDLPAIARAVVEAADDWPDELVPDYIGPLGDEGAIVLHLRGAGLVGPQNRLLRALAPQVRVQQFDRFRPHITLGYAPSVTPDQVEALSTLTVPGSVAAGPLVLRRGDDDRLRCDAAESYPPPRRVQEAAARALEVRQEKPASQRGMTAVGLARARDLANGRALSPETIRRMKAYFDRHQGDRKGSTWDDQGPGWQAWNGWGGDAGWAWARRIVARLEANEEQPA